MNASPSFRFSVLTLLSVLFCSASPAWAASGMSSVTGGDSEGQTHVVILGKDSGLESFPDDAVYEKGHLVNGAREGMWTRFHPNGNLRSEIEYASGDAFGEYRLYDEQGQLYEEGRWEYGMNVETLRRYWPNGSIQQILQFDALGVAQGEQRHFHDNGHLEMVLQLQDGQEHGDLIRLDRKGHVISRTTYRNGRIVQRS